METLQDTKDFTYSDNCRKLKLCSNSVIVVLKADHRDDSLVILDRDEGRPLLYRLRIIAKFRVKQLK